MAFISSSMVLAGTKPMDINSMFIVVDVVMPCAAITLNLSIVFADSSVSDNPCSILLSVLVTRNSFTDMSRSSVSFTLSGTVEQYCPLQPLRQAQEPFPCDPSLHSPCPLQVLLLGCDAA